MVTMAALCALLTVLGTWYMPEFGFPIASDAPSIDFKRDPVLGSPIPDLLRVSFDVFDRSIPEPTVEPDLVVFGGACSGCSLESVRFDRLPSKSFKRLFVVYESRVADIRSAITTPPPASS